MTFVDKNKRQVDDQALAAFSRKLARMTDGLAPYLSLASAANAPGNERRNIRVRAALAAQEAKDIVTELKVLRAAVTADLRTIVSHLGATKAYGKSRSPIARRR